MNEITKQFRDFFVSLKLTVVLLVFGIILVFAATWDQQYLGIWGIQQKWFRSFIVIQDIRGIPVPIFPGGYFVGGLLLINLVAAHVYRFNFTWKKFGIQMTHLGLILLLIGELMAGLWQEDFNMRLEQGVPKNYSESFHDNELAIVDTTDPQTDSVVVIPENIVARKESIQRPELPFRVVIKDYYPNSDYHYAKDAPNRVPPGVTLLAMPNGDRVNSTPAAMTYKQNDKNHPSALVELVGPQGSLGTWLVSTFEPFRAHTFEYNGRSYKLSFRFAREYKPYTLTLLKFSHDRYAGTNIPKNFSSQIRLQTPDGRDNREVLIYMNNPLRYAGMTFYQASFEEGRDDVTILQVVRNPSWLIPYVACLMMSLGLLWQFGYHLKAFAAKRRAPRPALA
jgi:hypothetical protein